MVVGHSGDTLLAFSTKIRVTGMPTPFYNHTGRRWKGLNGGRRWKEAGARGRGTRRGASENSETRGLPVSLVGVALGSTGRRNCLNGAIASFGASERQGPGLGTCSTVFVHTDSINAKSKLLRASWA